MMMPRLSQHHHRAHRQLQLHGFDDKEEDEQGRGDDFKPHHLLYPLQLPLHRLPHELVAHDELAVETVFQQGHLLAHLVKLLHVAAVGGDVFLVLHNVWCAVLFDSNFTSTISSFNS